MTNKAKKSTAKAKATIKSLKKTDSRKLKGGLLSAGPKKPTDADGCTWKWKPK